MLEWRPYQGSCSLTALCCCCAAKPRSFFQSHNASPAVEREVYRYYYYVYTRCKQVRLPIWHSLLNSPLVPVTFPTAYQPGGAPLLLLSIHVLQTSEAPAMSQCLAAAATYGASYSSVSLATTCKCAACFMHSGHLELSTSLC
jgi:hypothetical protein